MKAAPESNELLALLPQASKDRIFPKLSEVALAEGEEVFAADQELRYVYFPVDSVVSLLYVRRNGHPAEISVVGREGIVGIAVSIGEDSTPTRAVVQVAGMAYRLPASEFKRQFSTDSSFRWLMLSYSRALISQMAQTAMCSRHHSIEQQLCRWLLLSLDRLSVDELSLKADRVADTLGLPREDMAKVAAKLHDEGVVRYERGCITVVDRDRLNECSCECYAVVIEETERLAINAALL